MQGESFINLVLPNLCRKMSYKYCLKGETLYHEGENKFNNRFIYIILKGEVAILKMKDQEIIKKEFQNIKEHR